MIKNNLALILLVFLATSCSTEQSLQPEPQIIPYGIKVRALGNDETMNQQQYLQSLHIKNNYRVKIDSESEFNYFELVATESSDTLVTAINEIEEYAISFIESYSGEIIDIIISTTVIDEKGVISNLYDVEGNLQLSFHDKFEGEREIIFSNTTKKNGRIESSWWDCFDYCMGELNSPFDSNTANVIFGIAANATTGLTYTASTVVICTAAAGSMKKCSDEKLN